MYNADFWYMCPIWFIPASIIWVLLDYACEKKSLDERLSKRYGLSKRKAMKWIHFITGIVGFLTAFALILLISLILRFNLLAWEPL